MGENGVFVFPDAATRAATSGLDPNLLALLNNNGGFNGNGNWMWLIFLWMMWERNGRNGNVTDLAAQINGDTGRDFIIQAMNGRADALAQLAQMTNSSVQNVQAAINTLNISSQQILGQIGMSGLQTTNAVQAVGADIAAKICKCCCDNQLAICQQTNALQAQIAANHAAEQLQFAQAQGEDRLAVCQQTNQLGSQADRNTNTIVKAIADQNAMIVKEFCDLKERELQNKIDIQGDIITQLRGQISNDKQTEAFNAAINALNEKIALLAAKQPNTVPVQYPNIVAANATPYVGYYQGYPQNNFWS